MKPAGLIARVAERHSKIDQAVFDVIIRHGFAHLAQDGFSFQVRHLLRSGRNVQHHLPGSVFLRQGQGKASFLFRARPEVRGQQYVLECAAYSRSEGAAGPTVNTGTADCRNICAAFEPSGTFCTLPFLAPNNNKVSAMFLDKSVNCGPQRTFFDHVRHVGKATRGHEIGHAILGFPTAFRLPCNSEIWSDLRVSVQRDDVCHAEGRPVVPGWREGIFESAV